MAKRCAICNGNGFDFFYRKINNVAGFLICLNDQMRIVYFTDLDAVGRFVCFCKEYKMDNCRWRHNK